MKKHKKDLDLEGDINFTEDDLTAMRRLPGDSDQDISVYLNFLEEMGISGSNIAVVKYRWEIFEL